MTEALNRRLHLLYRLIEDSGLYINLNHDIRFREQKEIPLNLNETETIVIAEESYNSPLLLALLTAVLRNGTMILYGSPGSGKTTSAEFVGAFVHGTLLEETFGDGRGDFKVMEAIHEATIHGHHELTEEKMIGRPHLGKLMRDGEEDIIPRKFMLSPFRMVDEVNRLTPGRTNNLLEMMDRGFSVYGDSKIYAAEGATFLTANFRDVASSDLTPPFLDRIDVGVFAPTLNPYFLEMAQGGEDRKLTGDEEAYVAHLRSEIGVELTSSDFETIRREIAEVEVEPEALYILYNFISELNGCALASPDIERKNKGFAWFVKPPILCAQVDDGGMAGGGHLGGCHYHNTENICYKTENEVSVRAGKTIERYAKALAWFRGREKAGLEEVEAVLGQPAPAGLLQRFFLQGEGELGAVGEAFQELLPVLLGQGEIPQLFVFQGFPGQLIGLGIIVFQRLGHAPVEAVLQDAVALADHQLPQVALVVGHQHPDGPPHRGTTTRNRLPRPGRDVTSIRPPWSVTMPWAMASPRPVPCPGGLVVKNGSKMREATSAGIPGPSSQTSKTTPPSAVRPVRMPMWPSASPAARRAACDSMACSALTSRLSTTCWSWSVS